MIKNTIQMINILLPTDFSQSSINAIEYAMQLFRNEECNFYIHHVQKTSNYVTDDLMTSPSHSTVHQSILNTPKQKLQGICLRLRKENPESNIHSIIDYDSFIASVKQVVTSKNIHLIIMGTNGATGAIEIFLGSNTQNVIKKVDCPVIAIPQGFSFVFPKKILFARNSGAVSLDASRPFLKTIFQKFTPIIEMIHIQEEKTLLTENVDDILEDELFENVTYSKHSLVNIPYEYAISSAIQFFNTVFVILSLKKKNAIENFLKAYTSEKQFVNKTPILILK